MQSAAVSAWSGNNIPVFRAGTREEQEKLKGRLMC